MKHTGAVKTQEVMHMHRVEGSSMIYFLILPQNSYMWTEKLDIASFCKIIKLKYILKHVLFNYLWNFSKKVYVYNNKQEKPKGEYFTFGSFKVCFLTVEDNCNFSYRRNFKKIVYIIEIKEQQGLMLYGKNPFIKH